LDYEGSVQNRSLPGHDIYLPKPQPTTWPPA